MKETLFEEKVILGTAMQDRMAAQEYTELMTDEVFVLPQHRIVSKAVRELLAQKQSPTFANVIRFLQQTRQLADAGGAEDLTELLTYNNPLVIKDYCEGIKTQYIRRKTAALLEKYQRELTDPATAPREVNHKLTEEIRAIEDSVTSKGLQQNYEVAVRSLERVLFNRENGVTLLGTDTGSNKLNSYLDGWQPFLYLIAARPSMGKTAFMMWIKKNFDRQGSKGIIFSIETYAESLFFRQAAAHLQLQAKTIEKGQISEDRLIELRQFVEAQRDTGFIEDSSTLYVETLRETVRRHANEIQYVIIDYVQLMLTRTKSGNREQELAYISRQLAAVAKELKIPVIALAQISRAAENRAQKRPAMSDLRESGQLEQDARVVIFLWRPEYYGILTDENGFAYPPEYLSVMVGKNNNGPTGEVGFIFDKERMDFKEYVEPNSFADPVSDKISVPAGRWNDDEDIPF